MDSYLNNIYKKREVSGKKKKKLFEVELSEDELTHVDDAKVHVFKREPSWFDRLFRKEQITEEVEEDLSPTEMEKLHKMEGTIEHAHERAEQKGMTEQEEEVYREGLISKFLNFLRGTSRHSDYFEEEVVEEVYEEKKVPEEIKEAIKILNKWMKKLSKRNMELFKKSKDFERYKEILETYELVKKRTKKD